MEQQLLANNPPHAAFRRQFPFEPTGQFSGAAIGIFVVRIVKSNINAHR
jgi:hypothetical protein